jgi:hypothetical protein
MWSKNSLVFLIALVGYPILIFFCITFHKEQVIDSNCYFSRPCVRFCCKVEYECNESYVKSKFNSSHIFESEQYSFYHEYETENETREYEVFIGKPSCFLTQSSTEDWKYSTVSGRENIQISI